MNKAGPRKGRADVQGTEDLVTFIQIWEVADAAGIDGKRIAVYAQWASGAAFDHAISDPAAIAAHDRMAQVGTSDGTLYTLDRIYPPITPAAP